MSNQNHYGSSVDQPSNNNPKNNNDQINVVSNDTNANNNNNEQQQHAHNKHPLDPRRWVALGCLCAVGGINSAQQMNLAALTKASKHTFNLDDYELDWYVAIFYLMFMLFAFFSMSLFERYGLRVVLLMASIFNSLSTWLKLIVVRWYPGYYALFIAQVVCAFAQPLYMPLPPVLSCAWFPEDQRAIATSVAALCTALGTALGMAYAPFIVEDDGTITLFLKYLSIQAAFSTVETIINILFVVEEPEHAPSAAAQLRRKEASKHHHTPILTRMKQMAHEIYVAFKQKNKAMLLIGGGIFVGTLYAVPGAMCQIFSAWGISNNACGLMSGGIIIVGLIEGAIAGLYVDKTKKYRRTLLLSCCCGVTGMIIAGVAIVLEAPVILIGVCVIVGGSPLLAAFGIIMDAAAEETFPLDEVFSSTGVVYVGCTMAFIEMNAVPPILTAGSNAKLMSLIVWGIFLICMIIGTICLFVWQEELPRYKYELAKKEKEEQAEREGKDHDAQGGEDESDDDDTVDEDGNIVTTHHHHHHHHNGDEHQPLLIDSSKDKKNKQPSSVSSMATVHS